MGIKKVVATLLAFSMIFGSTVAVSAAGSPKEGPKKAQKESTLWFTDDGTTVIKIETKPEKNGVEFTLGLNKDNKLTSKLVRIGTGSPIFVSSNTTKVRNKTKAGLVVSANALKGSNVKTYIDHVGTTFEKDSATGSNNKIKIYLKNRKAVKNLKLSKDSGFKKGSSVVVDKLVKKSLKKTVGGRKLLANLQKMVEKAGLIYRK